MKLTKILSAVLVGLLFILNIQPAVAASANDSGLSLEVSPSPIVLTLKPGETKTVDVRIFNAGANTETLKIVLQNFTTNKKNSQVNLDDKLPPEVNDWIRFAKPVFTVKAGERVTQQVSITVPDSAGFSYNFAMVISRQNADKAPTGQSTVLGSVAIFTLLNIDRPGAIKKLTVESFVSSKKYYEYLPAELTLKLTNEGNSLILPAGNAFIQRTANSNEPITVLPINPSSLYLLPGVTRDYQIKWDDGLPHYVIKAAAANAPTERNLEWNWRDSTFRIGRYVARTVVVYNDGQRDVPVEAQVSFWVIPWKIILGVILAGLLLLVGAFAIFKFVFKTLKRNRFKYRAKN
jgi:hypothetical protein